MAAYSGHIRDLIKALKYDGDTRHVDYLGHLLFQHLDRHIDPSTVDFVLPNPTHVHRGVRHTELLVGAMARADTERRWNFDDPSRPALVKSRATVRAYGQDHRGRLFAAEALHRSMDVARPELVAGRRLLLVDDVATTGSQLTVLARLLEEHGAEDVNGLVLARSARSALGSRQPKEASLARLDALQRSTERAVPGVSL